MKKLFYNLSIALVLLLYALNSFSSSHPKYKVGLLVMATGKYTTFLAKLFESADKYFLSNHEVTYFVFTDGQVPKHERIIKIYQERLGWPYDTMMRFDVYYNARDYLADMDYLFACDADMLFVDKVGDEILGERVATKHPGFVSGKHDDYERNPHSTAYVPAGEGDYYFAGGFFGGTRSEFLKMAATCTTHILKDLMQDYIAIWHDESHLNRYFIDNKPTVILSPSYCYPEHLNLYFPKKLLALTKNHAEFRS